MPDHVLRTGRSMAPRAYWKGHLRMSLVSIPVEMYNAVESKNEISFRQIHKPSGPRINYTKTVAGIGEVKSADIVKGYEVDSDTYVTLEPEEIDALKLESKKTIDLTRFVDAADIDPRYFERPYYLGIGDKHGAEGYVVIREALRKTGKVGLGQVTVAGREWLVAVMPVDPDGLGMVMLRYADELRAPEAFFEVVPNEKPDKEMVDLAVELIERKSGKFEPDLSGLDFKQARLANANLLADLSGAKLDRTGLTSTNFDGAISPEPASSTRQKQRLN